MKEILATYVPLSQWNLFTGILDRHRGDLVRLADLKRERHEFLQKCSAASRIRSRLHQKQKRLHDSIRKEDDRRKKLSQELSALSRKRPRKAPSQTLSDLFNEVGNHLSGEEDASVILRKAVPLPLLFRLLARIQKTLEDTAALPFEKLRSVQKAFQDFAGIDAYFESLDREVLAVLRDNSLDQQARQQYLSALQKKRYQYVASLLQAETKP